MQPFLIAVTGAIPAPNNTLYYLSSAMNFISPQSPPTMILHGGTDIIVPSSQSDLLNARLIIAMLPVSIFLIPLKGMVGLGQILPMHLIRYWHFLRQTFNEIKIYFCFRLHHCYFTFVAAHSSACATLFGILFVTLKL